MCGIAGYIVNKPGSIRNYKLRAIARDLLLEIESRGTDAAGYAHVSKDQQVFIAKSPVSASELVDLPDNLLSSEKPGQMPSAMILHTRFSTQGAPANNMNNHPIYSKKSGLTMVHNGWMLNDDWLVDRFKLKKDAEVDSETYLRVIDHYYLAQEKPRNVVKAVAAAHKVCFGNIACGLLKANAPGVLWIWRNNADLVLCKVDFGYVFASTLKAIMQAMFKHTSARDITFVQPVYLPQDNLVILTDRGHFGRVNLKSPKLEELPEAFKGHAYDNDGKLRWSRTKSYSYRSNSYNSGYNSGYNNGYYRTVVDDEEAELLWREYAGDGWGYQRGEYTAPKSGNGPDSNGASNGVPPHPVQTLGDIARQTKGEVIQLPAPVDKPNSEAGEATTPVEPQGATVADPGAAAEDSGAQSSPDRSSPEGQTPEATQDNSSRAEQIWRTPGGFTEYWH